jgi:hypothetical protein
MSSFFQRCFGSSAVKHLGWLIVLLGCLHTGEAATLPTGFAETQIATNLNPTTMAFAPDGRLFLCESRGASVW